MISDLKPSLRNLAQKCKINWSVEKRLLLSCQVAKHGQHDLNFYLSNDGVCSDRPLKVRLGDFRFGAKSKELGSKNVKSIGQWKKGFY